MRCPILAELPPPPLGKTGWPWTLDSPQLPEARADRCAWPRISIVTPSYNQGQFIEETIRSILLQGYPDLEYFIVDGNSVDSTGDVLNRYARWLTRCVIEPDTGQSNAVNKGLAAATGNIVQWINSDDTLLPGALEAVGGAFNWRLSQLITGDVVNFGQNDECTIRNKGLSVYGLLFDEGGQTVFHQPGLWYDSRTIASTGVLSETLHFAFDWHYLIRYLDRNPGVVYLNTELAKFRLHSNSKTIAYADAFGNDRLNAAKYLLAENISRKTRTAVARRVALHYWWQSLAKLETEVQNGEVERTNALWSIALNAVSEPRVRLSRFTLGAMKKIALGI